MYDNELGVDDNIYSFFKYVEEYKVIPNKIYYEKNYEKILEATKSKNCKLIFPNAYNLIVNNCKPVNKLDFNGKLKDFLILTEKRGKFPNTTTAKFSDGTMIDSFLSAHIVKIYSLVSAGWYNKDYPIAVKMIEEYYNKYIEKQKIKQKYPHITDDILIDEFLKLISSKGEIPKSTSRLTFFGNKNVYNFWYEKKDDIYNKIMTGRYDDMYPKGIQIIKKEYNNYLEKRKRIIDRKKLKNIFFQYVEDNFQIPTIEDRVYLNDSSNMYEYWLDEKREIFLSALKNEYKTKYPFACSLIESEYYNFVNGTNIMEEYLTILENEKQLPGYQDERTLSNGIMIGPYWYNCQKSLYNLAKKDEYNIIYPNACQILKDSYIKHIDLILNKKSFRKKVEEILAVIEVNNKISNKDLHDKKFSDGTSIFNFIKRYIYVSSMYTLLQSGIYDEKYPKAVSIFYEKYSDYADESNNKNQKKF